MSAHAKPLHTAYIALGSNLSSAAGDPGATVRAALVQLIGLVAPGADPPLLTASSLYATQPVGSPEGLVQPAFVNAAACLRTALGPNRLLAALLGIERSFGRVRAEPNGPRTLDLDLLLVDDLVLSTTPLVLPHPRLHERRFVLAPLAEIAPTLRHPGFGRTITELLAALPDAGEQAADGVERL